MELGRKGYKTKITSNHLQLYLKSEENVSQYEIGAIYRLLSGNTGIVLFSRTGSLDEPPFIKVHNNKGCFAAIDQAEYDYLEIKSPADLQMVWVMAWDHDFINFSPVPANFTENELTLVLESTDDQHQPCEQTTIVFEPKIQGNLAVMARLDFSEPGIVEVTNLSVSEWIRGQTDYQHLMIDERLSDFAQIKEIIDLPQNNKGKSKQTKEVLDEEKKKAA